MDQVCEGCGREYQDAQGSEPYCPECAYISPADEAVSEELLADSRRAKNGKGVIWAHPSDWEGVPF